MGAGHYDQAQAILNSYPVGKQIEIYIDPNQPSQSVISQQKPPMKYLGYFMVMPILSFCLILWGFNFRRKAWSLEENILQVIIKFKRNVLTSQIRLIIIV